MRQRSIKRFRRLVYPVLLAATPTVALAGPACPDFTNSALARYLARHPVQAVRARADHAELTRKGVSELSGNVRLRRLDRLLETEFLYYNVNTEMARTVGPTYFQSSAIGVRGRDARVDIETLRGTVNDAHFTVPGARARGTAELARLRGENRLRLNTATYTTCAPGDADWLLSASRVDLNQAEDVGTARNVVLRFKGVPFLYTPWMTFPLSDDRKSGLLPPTVGTSGNTGFDLQVPYYLNLAPNRDATITARYMSKRGPQVGAQFRYLYENRTGQFNVEYMPRDQVTGDSRYLFDLRHHALFTPRLGLNARYARVSDDDYFRDLSSALDLNTTDYLRSELELAYQAPSWFSAQARAESYQTLVPGLPLEREPYDRLPQFLLDVSSPSDWYGFEIGMDGEYVNFTRDAGVQGMRTDVAPALNYRYDIGGWFLSARTAYRQTWYQLRETEAGQPESVSRGLPVVSARSGLRFERDVGKDWIQTLEPEVFYAWIPYRDQSDIPVFDTGLPDFSFLELFEANRFAGADRIGDTNRITTALTTRFLESDSGQERFRASLGQIYRFEDPRVRLPAYARPIGVRGDDLPYDQSASSLVGLIEYRITDYWSLGYGAEFDPYDGRLDRNTVGVRYLGPNETLFSANYRYRRGYLEQTDIGALVPLNERWRVFGRWNYSLDFHGTLQALAGFEYESCCYIVRAAFGRRAVRGDNPDDIETTTGFYVQLELKGLGRLGSSIEGLFKSDILGFD